jgi:chromosome segregation ATPase
MNSSDCANAKTTDIDCKSSYSRLEEKLKEIEKLNDRIGMLNKDIENLYENIEQKEKEVQKIKNWNN